jgi:exosome complex RNA-binding protein Rrp42 (RNase PH superfamily)
MPEEFSNEVLLQCFDEKEYLQKFLEQQIRVDGREFDQLRECSLSPAFLSQALGSSIVNLGGTKFTCGIECEVGKPSQDQPYSGDIVFDVHLWSISSVKYDQRGKCDDAYLLESMLDDVFSE